MGTKEQVSGHYMEMMRHQHAFKELRQQRTVLITGSEKEGSIGQAILNRITLEGNKTFIPFEGDVRAGRDRDAYNEIDTLIFCHGVTHLDWFEECPEKDIKHIIEVNLTATMCMTRDFVQDTIEMEWRKQIIYIGSMAYRNVLNGSAAYCASKAGLAMFARCMAWELAPKGYDVFIIHPSNTEGAPMSEDTIQGLMRYRHLNRTEAEEYWGACLPRDKWLQPGDIAEMVSHLMSGKAGYLSGTQIDMAGGQR